MCKIAKKCPFKSKILGTSFKNRAAYVILTVNLCYYSGDRAKGNETVPHPGGKNCFPPPLCLTQKRRPARTQAAGKEADIMAKLEKDLLYLYNIGKYYNAYNLFGAHAGAVRGKSGFTFTVWAPGVESVSVIGEYNEWRIDDAVNLKEEGTTGIWSGFVPGAWEGMLYKYLIRTKNGRLIYKADPFAFSAELRPGTASRVHTLDYQWKDARWMERRGKMDHFDRPKNNYEVHAGSWRRH